MTDDPRSKLVVLPFYYDVEWTKRPFGVSKLIEMPLHEAIIRARDRYKVWYNESIVDALNITSAINTTNSTNSTNSTNATNSTKPEVHRLAHLDEMINR